MTSDRVAERHADGLAGAPEPAIAERLRTDGIDYLLAQWVDIHGTPRCKGVPASALSAFLGGSAGFAGAATVGMGQGPHSHDLVGKPDFSSYTVVPWETGVARVACDITVDGEAWAYCSRTALKKAIERLATIGYEMRVGVEAEHMLVTRRPDGSIAPFDPLGADTLEKPCYDFKGLSANLPYLRELIRNMESLGWEPYASDHEDGTAQFELNWKYADALTTADRYTFFKMMTNQVARRHGAIATHMPKPFSELTGNGSHFHFSLWDRDARPVFLAGPEGDARGLGQSKLAYQFLGGLMAHARGLAAVIAPTVNCYKRLSIGAYLTGARSGFTWTPAFITYGDNNRTHMFRTPEPGRFECRAVSGAVNPYLAMAAFIAAGMDGIAHNLDPGEPIIGRNMYETSLGDMRREGLRYIPQSLSEAIDEFERDEVVQSALGPELAAEFIQVKRREWVRYHNDVGRWEVDQYLTLF
ncbi:MAG TPA: type III glutamate--ammonia ligase [Candidatus Saccharimonadales bacterium]|nr:type III glutamate--ammonia ligase [Candidatus Saccharimonadales bacterium]